MSKNWEGIIPIYINNYNQFTTTRKMAEYFDNVPGTEIIIIDNKSTYPPLLQWYQDCKYAIIALGQNGGHHAPWTSGVILKSIEHKKRYNSEYYIVTDADLDVTECPKDLISVLIDGKLHHNVAKSGLGIRINDLPDKCPSKNAVIQWEKQYWTAPSNYKTFAGIGFYNAFVDTTFALYSTNDRIQEVTRIFPAIRSDEPYCAKHYPWYITKDNIDDEYKFIIRSYPPPGPHMDRQDWINHLRVLLK